MNGNNGGSGSGRGLVSPGMWAGLVELMRAGAFAQDLERPAWEFAMRLDALERLGMMTHDLQWLVLKGYVEQGRQTSGRGNGARRSRGPQKVLFQADSQFVLTAPGREFVSGLLDRRDGPAQPRWDRTTRTLWLGEQRVKTFARAAANQELILAAFEEEGWPPRIDDPLPPVCEIDPTRRLRDTVGSLNQSQGPGMVRFRADGTGTGILWLEAAVAEMVLQAEAEAGPHMPETLCEVDRKLRFR